MRSNIEAERARLRLGKGAIAEKLGISEATYRAYVNGRTIPSDILLKMAELFECSIDYLLGRSCS